MKIIFTLALALIVSVSFAHPPDTTKAKKADTVKSEKFVKFTGDEINALYIRNDALLKRIHKLHLDALTRDSIDNNILGNQDFMKKRYIRDIGTLPADTTKKVDKAAKPKKGNKS